jgi:hypothetical protein
MPKFSLCLLLFITSQRAFSQGAAPPATGWSRVQQLKPGATLHIKTTTHTSIGCAFQSADDNSLTCTNKSSHTLQRTEIRSISMPHRGRSTLTGLAIGGGGGIITGAASIPNGQIVGKGTGAAVLGVGFGVIGAIIGFATDFTHSTIYRAP